MLAVSNKRVITHSTLQVWGTSYLHAAINAVCYKDSSKADKNLHGNFWHCIVIHSKILNYIYCKEKETSLWGLSNCFGIFYLICGRWLTLKPSISLTPLYLFSEVIVETQTGQNRERTDNDHETTTGEKLHQHLVDGSDVWLKISPKKNGIWAIKLVTYAKWVTQFWTILQNFRQDLFFWSSS